MIVVVHPRKVEVRAVEEPRPQIVVGVVIQAEPAAPSGRDRQKTQT